MIPITSVVSISPLISLSTFKLIGDAKSIGRLGGPALSDPLLMVCEHLKPKLNGLRLS